MDVTKPAKKGTMGKEIYAKPMSAPKTRGKKLKAASPDIISFQKRDGSTVSFPKRKN
jgi:hypothetical protein